jgi:UDP-N-acetylmuramate dehydrogenase
MLGGGSNIVLSDGGFDGLVVKNEMKGIRESREGDAALVDAQAGELWDDLVAHCVEKGYWGLENLSLIPGTVGASPVQNIGAYGVEAKDTIESVRVIDMRTGKEETFSNEECKFAYRTSVFKRLDGRHYAIVSVRFRLSLAPKPNLSYKDLKVRFAGREEPSLSDIRRAVIDIRTGKFPDLKEVGTAGSFWKNPIISESLFRSLRERYPLVPAFPTPDGSVKVPLAWLLDNACGLKGYVKGSVGLWKNQPLVLVAHAGATQAELDAFADEIAGVVMQKTGIAIEREVESIK